MDLDGFGWIEEWAVKDRFNELLLDLDGRTLPLEWSFWYFLCKAQHIETSLLPEPSSTGSFGKNIEYSAAGYFRFCQFDQSNHNRQAKLGSFGVEINIIDILRHHVVC